MIQAIATACAGGVGPVDLTPAELRYFGVLLWASKYVKVRPARAAKGELHQLAGLLADVRVGGLPIRGSAASRPWLSSCA